MVLLEGCSKWKGGVGRPSLVRFYVFMILSPVGPIPGAFPMMPLGLLAERAQLREVGLEEEVGHARLFPHRLFRSSHFVLPCSRLRRRGRGVARFRLLSPLPPCCDAPGRGRCARGWRPLGWARGGRGRLRPRFSAFPNCGRWEGAGEPGTRCGCAVPRGGSGRCGAYGLELGRGSCCNFVCKGPGVIRRRYWQPWVLFCNGAEYTFMPFLCVSSPGVSLRYSRRYLD